MKSPLAITSLALTLVALAGCADWGDPKPTYNYSELIPRFMNAANQEKPEEAAAKLFDVTSPDERRDAIAYLETKPWGHEAPYMRAYEMLTTDPHPLVRAQAMRALGGSHQARAYPFLIKGLSDPDMQVRRDAAIGLTYTFTADAIAPLCDLLKHDPEEQVRLNCARALVNSSTPEATRALIDALDDKDAAVVYNARQSLWSTTREDFGYDSRAWLTWYQAKSTPATSTAPATTGVQ